MAGNSDIRSSDIYRDDPVRDTVIPLHVPYKADAADANAALAVGDGQVAYIVPDRGHIVAVTASLSDGGAGGTSTTIQLRRLHPIIAVPGTFDAGEDVLYDDAAHTPAIDQRLVVSGSADAAPAFAGITDADTFDPGGAEAGQAWARIRRPNFHRGDALVLDIDAVAALGGDVTVFVTVRYGSWTNDAVTP